MAIYSVKVKWNKETYDLELNTEEPPNVFKAQIFAVTGVHTDRQKVMFKGAALKDEDWNPALLKSIKNGATFLMIGSCEELPDEPQEKVVFMEDMTENQLTSALELPTGLVNLGNTCYLNATIQCLLSVPELRECLKKYQGSLTLNESFDGAHDIVVSLRDICNKMGNTATVMPVILLEMLHMMFPQFAEKTENGQLAQQDANECWCELLKVLQQKLTFETKDGQTKNFINQYFSGTMLATMKCVETKDDKPEDKEKSEEKEAAVAAETSTSTENFLQLSCFISQDVKYLQTGLKLRLEEEISKFSPALNRNAQYLKTSRISRLPAYLSVNLIRFFYKGKNSINAKILKDVKFSLSLDLFDLCTPELQKKLLPMRQKFKEMEDRKVEEVRGQKAKAVAEAAAAAAGTNTVGNSSEKNSTTSVGSKKEEYYDYWFDDDIGSNNSGMYQLQAVLTHKGRSSSSGHYVGWIKHKDKWFKCDDDQVYQVTEEEILKLSGGGDWHCAYVLLYGPQLVEKS